MGDNKKLIKTQIWTMTLKHYVDDEGNIFTKLLRQNDGFSATELLSLAEYAKQEIILTIRGRIEPDIVKREVLHN
jgi:hypothetical protein